MNIVHLKDSVHELSSIQYVKTCVFNLPVPGYQIVVDTSENNFISYSLVKGTEFIFSHVVLQLIFCEESEFMLGRLPCCFTMHKNGIYSTYNTDTFNGTITVSGYKNETYLKLQYPIQEEEYFQRLTQIDLPEVDFIDNFIDVSSSIESRFPCFLFNINTNELAPELVNRLFQYLLTKKGEFQKV